MVELRDWINGNGSGLSLPLKMLQWDGFVLKLFVSVISFYFNTKLAGHFPDWILLTIWGEVLRMSASPYFPIPAQCVRFSMGNAFKGGMKNRLLMPIPINGLNKNNGSIVSSHCFGKIICIRFLFLRFICSKNLMHATTCGMENALPLTFSSSSDVNS